MKKVTLAIILAAIIVFAGCKKNQETAGTTLKASIEQQKSDDSKTSLNPTNGAIYWSDGDKVLVYNGTSSATFSLTNGAGFTNGTFTYNGEFEITGSTMALYPETGVITDNSVSFTLPEEQNLDQPGTFANGVNPMLGINTSDGFTFVSICGGLGLSLKGDDIEITAIEIVSEGEMLNGTITGYFNSPDVDIVGGTNSVRLNCATTLTSEAKEFFIVLPVGVLSSGFTLNVYDGASYPFFTKTTPTDLTVELNKVKKMNELVVTKTTPPVGAIDGMFTVNANGGKVYISQGNLQYRATTNTWQFAEHQYDFIGANNANISQTYDGWIDLFAWGTSGYNHGALAYKPWNTIQNTNRYYAYGNQSSNLYDSNGQADWGYNAISNGGNTENQWRTMTQPEWNYVIKERNTPSGIRYAKAKVNNVNGVILLPDNWRASIYALNKTNSGNEGHYDDNIISSDDWANTLEAHGAVFFPAAGFRNGTTVSYAGAWGDYWTASVYNWDLMYSAATYFTDPYLVTHTNGSVRWRGQSVRLVRSAE